MCNACGNVCCGSDQFGGCGCDGCYCTECWSDEPEDGDDEYFEGEHLCVTPQDCTPPELKEVLRAALAKAGAT